jgi:plastocyanin
MRIRVNGKAVIAGGVLFALLGTGCAGPRSPTGSGATKQPTAATDQGGGGYGDAYGGRYGGSSPSDKTGDPLTIEEGAGDGFAFSPSSLTVRRGQTITLDNAGDAPHTFTIADEGIDVTNNPGQVREVTVDLAPGTYAFVCRFHRDRGMKGTLTVEP